MRILLLTLLFLANLPQADAHTRQLEAWLLGASGVVENFDVEFIQQQQTLFLSGDFVTTEKRDSSDREATIETRTPWNIYLKIRHSGDGKTLHVIGSNILPTGAAGRYIKDDQGSFYQFGSSINKANYFVFRTR